MSAVAARVADPLDKISPRNFNRLSAHIYDQAGIKMPASKQTMLEGRLRRRVRATGVADLNSYCDLLFDHDRVGAEALHLLNAVTTNKTDFFREPRYFDYLRQSILPALKTQGHRRIRAWSAACSTGAEPYTMAMVFDDFAERQGGPDYGVLATDLDTEVLETARRGVYPADMLDPVPAAMRDRYVMRPLQRGRGDVRIVPALRSAVGFARLNLMDARYPVGDPMDIIFCRNVLIYFDKPTQEKVVSRLCDQLRPGGWLLLGHSESIAGMDLPVKQVSNTVFQRN
ncbi:chemotaxis protein methyltransferase CheR [Sphingomonas gellani]|uniref:Chemotaxis protein methyltransferase n=1 Tax=Sphingomonas gellani TaxID=1166340 RepID=A0A1H7ZES7_9SPHN|nr:protein-glutamate O-methyltransferase [Sphingomonas gellani]SEM56763.1 chemotaxis protein methyltransferase CheR [Sphingomonas gellani]